MRAKEVLKLLKISRVTLCKYAQNGTIRAEKNVNGYYNYSDEDVYRLASKKGGERKSVIYARVSSACQKKDL